MFDRLVKCKTHFDVLKLVEKHFEKMSEKAVAYLTKGVSYELQFPASRCAMGPNVYMYMRLTSSGGESMNNANNAVRQAAAVDCINATILLLRLESEQFAKQQTSAWITRAISRLVDNKCSTRSLPQIQTNIV